MLLNIYKPKDWTSFGVVAKVRKLSGVKKCGHAGTLDPLAEGVLIVLTDEDTKKQDQFMKLDKEYYFECAFGISTPSIDLEFTPTFTKKVDPTFIFANIDEVIKKFTGEIYQQVPVYSAKKVHGQRLYKLARSNKDLSNVPLPVNCVSIYKYSDITISNKNILTDMGEKSLPVLACSVSCSSGTYIRSLVKSIGLALGSDAVTTKLIRTRIGDYRVKDSIALEELKF